MTGRSCLTALGSFYDKVTQWMKEKLWMSSLWTLVKPLIAYPTESSWRNLLFMGWTGELFTELQADRWDEPRDLCWLVLHSVGGQSQLLLPRAQCCGQSCLISLTKIWIRHPQSVRRWYQIGQECWCAGG